MTTPVYQLVQQSDNLGTWLAFIGAILVSLIAAGTAQWRLRAQLAADAQRDGEQQSFDRAQSDRAELRSILDTLADNLRRLERSIYVLKTLFASPGPTSRPVRRRGRRTHDPGSDDRLSQAHGEVRTSFLDSQSQIERLKLRLGPEDENVVEAATRAIAYGASIAVLDLDFLRDHVERLADAETAVRKGREAFTENALELTRAHVYRPVRPSPGRLRRVFQPLR